MANEKMVCNQICRWNDPSNGCILPAHAICPLANTEPDASGWGQVQENKKRLIDANVVYEMGHRTPFHISIADLCDLKELLEDVPTVDAVEVVHAHWEDGCAIHNGKEVYKSIDCSHCNEIFKTDDREYWKARFKVCPFCGAIMDGERREGE